MVSSLMMLDWALDSHNPGGVFQNAGLPALTFNQVQTTMYLKISLSDFLTVFAARTRGFFTERYVARILVCPLPPTWSHSCVYVPAQLEIANYFELAK